MCPCGSTKTYQECCQPFHNEMCLPATAEELMRSRYSAFCLKKAGYLLNTWYPGSRPEAQDIISDSVKYLSLEILDTSAGLAQDAEGTVTFIAKFIENDQLFTMEEKSSFLKQQGKWFYTDGENDLRQDSVKKNGPCPCGSGKKFKRCCL